jgi:hypothetical protein
MNLILKRSASVCLALLTLTACNEQTSAEAEPPNNKQEKLTLSTTQPTTNVVNTIPKQSGIKIMWQTATVKYMEFEGGFWGLVTENGQKLLPMNLAKEFRQFDAVVKFQGQVKGDVMTIQQWGTPFKITEMTLIKAGIPVDSKNNPLL